MLILAVLLISTPASAWHWEDEEPNEQFGAKAGDPRVLEDGAPCHEALDATDQAKPDEFCLVLYAHQLDLLNRGYLNTQRPAECAEDLARGFTTAPHVEPYWNFHRKVLSAQSGFTEYTDGCVGAAQAAGSRDYSEQLRVSDSADILGYWHLSADALEVSNVGVGSGPEQGPSTGVMPCVTVRMVLETGPHPGAGRVIAEGETTKTILTTPDGEPMPVGVQDLCPGATGEITGEEVTEFEVNLGSVAADLPPDGFHVEVQWYQHDGGDPDNENNVVQNDWNMRTGAEHLNRILMPVRQTHHVDQLTTTTNGDGTITVDAKISSVLGRYDVDLENLRLQVIDPQGAPVDLQHVQGPVVNNTWMHVHGGHLWPLEAQFLFDPEKEGFEPEGHSVRVLAANWQHTTVATHAAVTNGPLQEATTPLPLMVILLAFAAATVVVRRKSQSVTGPHAPDGHPKRL